MSAHILPPARQKLVEPLTHYLRHLLRSGRSKRLFLLFCGLLLIGRWAGFQQTRTPKWNEQEEEPLSIPIPSKSKFHLLVTTSATTRRENLCKCLLSAAILEYPPPTLVNYERSLKLRRGRENVQDIYDFLTGKEVGGSDIVSVISEDVWVQVPPAVTLRRFLYANRLASVKDRQKVLFGGIKQDTKIHDFEFHNPRFLASNAVMGKVGDLIPVYRRALDLLRATDQEKYESQDAMSQMFREQEAYRVGLRGSWEEFFSICGWRKSTRKLDTGGSDYEFGIGIDYEAEVFQIVGTAEEDVQSFRTLNELPLDLLKDPPWSELELERNTVAPGSRIPSVLGFKINKEDKNTNLSEELWPKMWFYKHSRELMKNYLDSSKGIGAAESAEKGGRDWWDMRGGRGGVWTGRGEWLAWKEVCGGVDGLYGDEEPNVDEVGNEGVVRNSFGNVVEGDDGGKGLEKLRFGGGGV